MINNRNILVASIGIFLILIAPYVLASGVSSPYGEGEYQGDPDAMPLKMYPGETKDFQFTLMNAAGGPDQTFKVVINKGTEVISLADSIVEYSVPAGSTEVPVNVRAIVPVGTPIGTVYKIEVEFKSAPAAQSGQFQFGSGFVKKFDLIVGEKPQESTPAQQQQTVSEGEKNNTLIIVLIVAIILAIILIIWVKSRNKNSKR